jgi:hypothetical protein
MLVSSIASYPVGLVRSIKDTMAEKGIEPIKIEDQPEAWKRLKGIHEKTTESLAELAQVLVRLSDEKEATSSAIGSLKAEIEALPSDADSARRSDMTAKLLELQELQDSQSQNLNDWTRIFEGRQAYSQRMAAYFAQFNDDGTRKAVDASA